MESIPDPFLRIIGTRKFNFQMSRLTNITLVLLKKLMNSDHLMIFVCNPRISVSSETGYIGQFMMICLTSSLRFNFLRFGQLSSSTKGAVSFLVSYLTLLFTLDLAPCTDQFFYSRSQMCRVWWSISCHKWPCLLQNTFTSGWMKAIFLSSMINLMPS